MSALKGLRIVEITEQVTGEYAARLLADFGAETLKIEPPGGSPVRAILPDEHQDGLLFAWLNTNKRSVVIDPDVPEAVGLIDRALARADALVTDLAPHAAARLGIDRDRIADVHPHLVRCAITPFGETAPDEWQQLSAINIINASGWAWHSPSEALPDSPPLQGPGPFLAAFEAGLEAALATSASLWRKRQTGQGQNVDISAVATMLSRADCVLGRMLAGEQDPSHARTCYDMGGPGRTFVCADGHVFLIMTTQAHWKGLSQLMDAPEWLLDFPPDWLEFHCTPDRVARFREHFADWVAVQPRNALSDKAQRLGVPLVPVNRPGDLPRHDQFLHRGFFQRLGDRVYPTVPYRMSASPTRISTPAPALGADQVLLS